MHIISSVMQTFLTDWCSPTLSNTDADAIAPTSKVCPLYILSNITGLFYIFKIIPQTILFCMLFKTRFRCL